MSYDYQTRASPFNYYSMPISRAVKFLLGANVLVFLFLILFNQELSAIKLFGLIPSEVVEHGRIWQPLTYLFLHDGWMPLLMNAVALYFFGTDVEREMGTRNFCLLYFFSGVGAGLTAVILSPFSHLPTIGASGAVFGLLTAYGVLFPNRVVSVVLFFIFPVQMRARNVALFFGFLEFLFLVNDRGGVGGVSRMAHLSGIVFGYLYMRYEIYILDWVTAVEGWILRREENNPNGSGNKDTYITRTIDPILDKISKQGIHSLTRKERKILERAKKKFSEKI